ncbi:MAG: YfbR-like 5'-deoxynucleotidase [Patescibacteria group bacterium]
MKSIFNHITNRSLAHVIRFSSHPQHFQESVAEHSFFTAYITAILCDLVSESGTSVNAEKAIAMALIHDSEEVFSGDILSPFKHHSPAVKEAIRDVNKELIKEVFEDLPEGLREKYTGLWNEEGRQEGIEAQIVKVADRLSLVGKCAEEMKAGNQFFKNMHDHELRVLEEDGAEWWVKIKGEVLGREIV